MQFVNAVFATASLWLLRKILFKQTNDAIKSNILTLFVASSFAVMRFAVEAETYVIPIFFSIASSYFYYKYLLDRRNIHVFLSALSIAAAVLFHQIHLFWGIALFVGFLMTKNYKTVLIYVFTVLLVPAVYAFVLVFYYQINFSFENLLKFAADFYYYESGGSGFDWQSFIITPITFFRTFFQVHGIVVDVLKLMPVAYGIIPVVLIFVVLFFYKFVKTFRFNGKEILDKPFELIHLLVFILQFGFAFYSQGNSEFMVMLPFVLVLFIFSIINFDINAVKYITAAMLIWNFFFSVFPNNIYNYQNNQELVKFADENPEHIFVLKESGFVSNLYYYETGKKDFERFINMNDVKALNKLPENLKIYTDVFSKRVPYNRMNIVNPFDTSHFIFKKHVKWIPTDLGGFYVDEAAYSPSER